MYIYLTAYAMQLLLKIVNAFLPVFTGISGHFSNKNDT